MSQPPEAPSSGEPAIVTSSNFGEVIPTATGTTTIVLGTSNSPAVVASGSPYCYFQVNAPDGTKVYIPAWK